ncbi:DUF4007 family protein [Bengtsoniella intestinalis]|uniref:DUF4007 family protein n=1 Tax=Bengtsoniella intestinalis TaxID=3073143 RepID=UPI00391F2CF8
MKFRAHESFFIRKNWLHKGLRNVDAKPNLFSDKTERAMDVLGIGSSMVKALRYWLIAVGLTTEPNHGAREHRFTDLANIIWKYDRYIEETGTLWLLHYNLASNDDKATAWYYFFNQFNLHEFNKDDYVQALGKYVQMKFETTVATSSLEGDFDCILSTYLSRKKTNPAHIHPENNIDCPFGDLGLIDVANAKERIYRKKSPAKNTLDPMIALAVIIKQADGAKEINIAHLLNSEKNIGKTFNLDMANLVDILYQIARLEHISITRTAGLDVIHINTEMSFLECVTAYYESLAIT